MEMDKESSAKDVREDAFGNVLKVGDDIYYASALYGSKGYRLRKGQVAGFTEKMVKVRKCSEYSYPQCVSDDIVCLTPVKIGKVFPRAFVPTEQIDVSFDSGR